ncbi:hypothetical protein BSL78_13791 [Apostichopus japonicus]|uniref:HYR domain-containing protein n=1 Tax=Stichopus japonicus TaxID=307972 RepID=A0A2G8KMU2_STIJA|nr:hypothetical protein BSL78_13791 [Apostichopus japonicus]
MPPGFVACPHDIMTNNTPTLGSAEVSFKVVANDDLDDNLTVSSTHSSGDTFTLGATNVTYTATDYNGQTAECSFTVTVNDNEMPVISDCPADMVATILPGQTSGMVFWTPPTASDNSGESTLNSGGDDPGDVLMLGNTTVTYVAKDPSGNQETCTFTITVVEDEPPTFTNCPVDQTLPTDEGEDFATAAWTAPTADDRESSPVVESNYESGDEFPLGNTTVEYVATDSLGQTANCSFDIIVNGCAYRQPTIMQLVWYD